MAAPCIFFQKGRCNAGRSCRFSHDPAVLSKKLPTAPCKFFQEGRCTAGDACPYLHVIVKKEKPKTAAGAAYRAQPTVPKPTVGVAVHTKATLRSDAWGGSHAGARATLGDSNDDDKYVPETFTLGGDDQAGREGACADEAAAAAGNRAEGGGSASYAGLVRQGLDEELIDSTAVAVGDDTPISAEEARHRQFVREQIAASQEKECGICMELVLPKGSQFGLLDGCSHIFCLSCIREWRNVNTLDKAVKRSCPLCRSVSNFVIPSSFFPPSDESKADVMETYHGRLRKIACRHFNYGEGECPFGTSCFYEHRYRDGSLQQTAAPRLKVTQDGEVEAVKKMSLSDVMDFGSLEAGARGGGRRR